GAVVFERGSAAGFTRERVGVEREAPPARAIAHDADRIQRARIDRRPPRQCAPHVPTARIVNGAQYNGAGDGTRPSPGVVLPSAPEVDSRECGATHTRRSTSRVDATFTPHARKRRSLSGAGAARRVAHLRAHDPGTARRAA